MFYKYFENLIEACPSHPRFGKSIRIRVTFSYWWRTKWNKLLHKIKVTEPLLSKSCLESSVPHIDIRGKAQGVGV